MNDTINAVVPVALPEKPYWVELGYTEVGPGIYRHRTTPGERVLDAERTWALLRHNLRALGVK